MAKNTRARDSVVRLPKKAAKVSGNSNQMKKLKELQSVTKELDQRSKVSSKLHDKQRKLKEQLGLDPFF